MLFVVGRALRRDGYSDLQRALFRSILMENAIDSNYKIHKLVEKPHSNFIESIL